MKRRSQTCTHHCPKPTKHSSKHHNSKKRNAKSQIMKTSHAQKKVIEEYVIINDTVYTADSKTQRYEVDQFVSRLRSQAKLHKSRCSKKMTEEKEDEERKRSNEQSTQIISMEDYVNGLSKEQKLKLLEQLEKEMIANNDFLPEEAENKDEKCSTQDQDVKEKMQLLGQKLEFVKKELETKRDDKLSEINKKFNSKQITDVEYRKKIKIVNKVMEQNLKVIECTKNLFETILNSSYDHEILKNRDMDVALKELDSFTALDSPATHQRVDSEGSINSEGQIEKLQLDFKQQKKQDKKMLEEPLLISPDKAQTTDLDFNKFHCAEETLTKKFKIPLLMTKDKLEEIEQEKNLKALQKMRIEIDKKISFQMSEIEPQQLSHHQFTTLAGINNYIVGLYEYIIKVDLDRIVERLNFPFGKSVRDKLYLLQQNGEIDDSQYYPVLDDCYYHNYNKKMILQVRKVPQQEKVHCKAIFDCFNTYLNAYRPYYQLEGQVYPWSISEKGITFYQINQQNLEQVFEKTKIKVLEFASTLCGILPHGMEVSQGAGPVKDKNQQFFLKEEKLATIQNFNKWDIKVSNYNVMMRFQISEEILFNEIQAVITDFL